MLKETTNNYESSSIVVLKGLEPIRKRPGMYIGNVEDGTGLLHMLFEVLDNSVDESIAGHCDLVKITLYKDQSISVLDNGRGIPTAWHEDSQRPTPETVMITIHSGGKFDSKSYAVSGGLHGVGLCAVNALSESLNLRISRDGHVYEQNFKYGLPEQHKYHDPEDWRGTFIKFKADTNIFGEIKFNSEDICEKLREVAYLNSSLKLEFYDENTDKSYTFAYRQGLESYLEYTLSKLKREPFTDKISLEEVNDNDKIALSLCYSKSFECYMLGYTNNIKQEDGGSHVTGLKSGIAKAVLKYLAEDSEHKKQLTSINITADDTRSGIVALISVHTGNPSFSSQTKDKLVSSAVRQAVDNFVSRSFYEFLLENRDIANKITERVILAVKARESASQQKDVHKQLMDKGLLISSLVGKLGACKSKDPSVSELFLVEGESAGGTAKYARDRIYQAVLPLKGKIMNVQKADMQQALNSEEIVHIFKALNSGINEQCDPSRCRYHKIVIMADADPDGKHICTLALTVFYNYLRPLIEAGFVYICYPPLFSFKDQGKDVYFHNHLQLQHKLIDILLESNINVEIKTQHNQFTVNQNKINRLVKDYVQYQELKNNTHIANCNSDLLHALIISTAHYPNDMEQNLRNTEQYLQYHHPHKFTLEHDDQSYNFTWVEEGLISFIKPETIMHHKGFKQLVNQYNKLAFYKSEAIISCKIQYGRSAYQHDSICGCLEELFDNIKKHKQLKRYKGLGEMNPNQLWDSSMNPDSRTLIRVNIDDAQKAAEIMEILMGNDVGPRKEFIVEHANNVSFDIM